MSVFRFRQFEVRQDGVAMKVGTDGVLLGAWADLSSAHTALDIGTGTGVISLILAQRNNSLTVDGIEIEQDAAEIACYNAAKSKFRKQIQIFQASLGEWMNHTTERYDLMISNLPFYSRGFKIEHHQRKLARVAESLPHTQLLEAFKKMSPATGTLNVILPLRESHRFLELTQANELYCSRKTTVFSKPEKAIRMLLEIRKTDQAIVEDELTIGTGELNSFTDQYCDLTKDLYLNM